MSTSDAIKNLGNRVSHFEKRPSSPLPTAETLFDIFDGIRILRPELGMTPGIASGIFAGKRRRIWALRFLMITPAVSGAAVTLIRMLQTSCKAAS